VVVRTDGDGPRVLVVSARRAPDEWVLPKGHIEAGETAGETAAREVLEEAGVVATAGESLGTETFTTPRGRVTTEFFLMRFDREGPPGEGRRRGWLTVAQARAEVSFPSMTRLIVRACQRVTDRS
jgi:8-oxo-dGTP pyrophosphatase MutT (NUDIX family)